MRITYKQYLDWQEYEEMMQAIHEEFNIWWCND
jgi:hypothetical protein